MIGLRQRYVPQLSGASSPLGGSCYTVKETPLVMSVKLAAIGHELRRERF